MKCPICSTSIPAGSQRCPDCGYRCPNTSVPVAEPVPQHSIPHHERRSILRRFGCCLGVFTAVCLIFGLLGFSLFSFLQFTGAEVIHPVPEYSVEASVPEADAHPESAAPDREDLPEVREDCFSIANGAVEFHSESWDGGRVLQIPDTVTGEKVTALAPGCFRDCPELTTIILPESLATIDTAAFAGCTNLRGLYIPEGCTAIGADAFDGCISMEAVSIPGTMESVAPGAFDDCASLRLLFYAGDYEAWNAIYSDYITPFTAAICFNGSYYHGVS